MSNDAPMKLALLGAGMLGGSFALALKEAGNAITITSYDPVRAHAETLLANGTADAVAETPEAAVANADIVMIAAPMGSYRALAKAIGPALSPGTIVTDLGSVKTSVALLASLMPNALLVPGHPIAGSEQSGPAAARADLFRGRLCILTPDATTDANAREIVTTLWHAAGADVIEMPAEVHDQVYAYMSHLPHYIAFIAASYFHQLGVALHAEDDVLQRFLRISRSNPRMWADIAIENREALLPVMATYRAVLEHFTTELRAGEKHETTDRVGVAKLLLPRILAASLISAVSLYEQQSGMNLRPFGAGGMRDIAAPAAHTPEDDTEAISHAAHAVADHLDALIAMLRTLEAQIGAEDNEGLFAAVSRFVADAQALATPRN